MGVAVTGLALEALAKEFGGVGSASIREFRYAGECDRCGKTQRTLLHVEFAWPDIPKALQTQGNATKLARWRGNNWKAGFVCCPDRPACKLRKAKQVYHSARREEKARKRARKALRT